MLYDKLPEGESFRLLEIQPGAKHRPLICHLFTVKDLKDVPDYECISYVWGDPTDTEEIQCGLAVIKQRPKARHILNKLLMTQKRPPLYPFSVTRNLAAALRRLRTRSRRRLVWADAICINQTDDLEKGHQVAHMDKIYANARTVFVWLGQSDENFGVAIRSMDAIYDCCCKLAKLKGIHKSAYNAELRKSDPTPIYLPGGNDFAAANTLLPSTCSYEDLDLFFGHPWFRRVWVIQEVARCQNVQMMSDRFQYSWDLVALATYWLSLVYIDKKSLYSDFQNIEGLVNTIFMRSKSSKSSERTNFVGFLDRVRSFDATDPRDKVYGVLSWLNDFPPKLSSMFLPALYPDYTKSTLAVYTLVAIRSIELSQDLDILSHGFHGSSLEEDINIPSWVPQWNRGRRASFLLYYGLALDASRGKKYGINSQLQAQLSNDERSLKLNGVQCGVANRVTNHVPRLESLHGEITGESVLKSPLLGLLEALTSDLEAGRINSALICSANAPYDQRINPDYVRRLILGVELGLPSRIQGSFPMATSGADFASYIVAHIELLPEDNILKRSLDSGLLQDIADADGNAARFAKSGCYTWRRFFTTRTGYIGFGPACMREDDIICILRGGRVPYVLREKDNHWLFLGECYVHGIMLGEAVHLNEAGSWVGEETFELR